MRSSVSLKHFYGTRRAKFPKTCAKGKKSTNRRQAHFDQSYSIHRIQEVHATLVHVLWDLIHIALGAEDVI